jgi:hypothetical protein
MLYRGVWQEVFKKAYAKFVGYTINMAGGTNQEGLYTLTGMPYAGLGLLSERSIDDLWNLLSDLDRKKYIMTTTNSGLGSEKYGIAHAHAYAILGVAEYNGERLVRMRNPWGDYDKYTGPWSDQDTEKWTPEALKALNFTPGNDGEFYASLSAFREGFGELYVSFYDDYKTNILEDTWERVITVPK